MYQLIALDMDGTLLNSQHEISETNQHALRQAQAQGIHVVLASGRPRDGLQAHLETLGLTGLDHYVISYNGALVQRVGNGEVLHQSMISGKDIKDVYAQANKLGVFIHAFSAELGLITPKHNPYTELEARINQIEAHLVDFDSLSDDHPFIKVMMVADKPDIDRVQRELSDDLAARFTVARSYPYFLEFLHPECNKGVGLAKLAQHLNIAPAHVVAMGDAENDWQMLDFAGLAVAMDNAGEETKARANVISTSNDKHGVAEAVNAHVLRVLA